MVDTRGSSFLGRRRGGVRRTYSTQRAPGGAGIALTRPSAVETSSSSRVTVGSGARRRTIDRSPHWPASSPSAARGTAKSEIADSDALSQEGRGLEQPGEKVSLGLVQREARPTDEELAIGVDGKEGVAVLAPLSRAGSVVVLELGHPLGVHHLPRRRQEVARLHACQPAHQGDRLLDQPVIAQAVSRADEGASDAPGGRRPLDVAHVLAA